MLAYSETVSECSNENFFPYETFKRTLTVIDGGSPIDLTPEVKYGTDIVYNVDSETTRLITTSGKPEKTAPPNEEQHLKSEINGSVIQVQNVSVKCDIYSANHEQIIHLPKSLFPSDVKIGMAFTLSLDNSSGIRRPIVKTRPLSENLLNKGKDEVAALINEL